MIVIFGLMAAFPIGDIFGLSLISGIHWLIVAGLSLAPIAAREIGRFALIAVQEKFSTFAN
jgi:hypothetical protein